MAARRYPQNLARPASRYAANKKPANAAKIAIAVKMPSHPMRHACTGGTGDFGPKSDNQREAGKPFLPPARLDRDVHAEEAIEASFDALATKAELMGWTRDKAAFALLNLAAARVLTMEANQCPQP